MNRQILESLLMDQAFEELSPECEQLLAAYLEDHPEHKTLAESICETATIGQRTVAQESPQSLPSLSLNRMENAQKKQTRKIYGRWWLSAAACLVFGILIGVIMMTGGSTRQNAVDTPANIAQAPTSGLEAARAFWSVQNYIKQFQENREKRMENKSKSIFQLNVEKFTERGAL